MRRLLLCGLVLGIASCDSPVDPGVHKRELSRHFDELQHAKHWEGESWKDVVARDPRNAGAWNQLALENTRVSMAPGPTPQLDEAIKCYSRAIELEPEWVDAYCGRAGAREWKADFSGSIADYSRAIELTDEAAEIFGRRAHPRWASGDLEGALADFNQAIRGGAATYRGERGRLLYAMGRSAEALTDFRAVLSEQDDELSLWIWLAQCRLGLREQATDELRTYKFSGMHIGFWPFAPWEVRPFLLGDIPATQLLANSQAVPGSELHFFVGSKQLLEGDASGAREEFQLAQSAQPWEIERLCALAELRRLDLK